MTFYKNVTYDEYLDLTNACGNKEPEPPRPIGRGGSCFNDT